MTIVLVIDVFDQKKNGTTMSARRFAELLRERGHEVRVISTGKPEKDKYVVKTVRPPIINSLCEKQSFQFAKADKKVIREALKGADVVHLYMAFPLEIKALREARKMGIPCTGAFHIQPENITYNINMKRAEWLAWIIYRLFRRFYNKLDHVHCPSEFIASQLKKHKYKAKLHVISNGITKEFVPDKEVMEQNKIKNRIDVLMIGRLSPEKRQDLAIEAVKLSKYSSRIHLHFAGFGPMEKEYKKMASTLHNPATFNFYDQKDLINLIHSCDLYVHTSEIEIEAIACIEAISCGLVPVIANSKKSAAKQFALDERSLFESGNAQDLADKIDYWIENPDEKKRMSEKYVLYSRNYDINKSIDKAEAMFMEAIRDAR